MKANSKAPSAAAQAQAAASRLADSFQPGQYALRAYAGAYAQVYRFRLRQKVDLAHMPTHARNSANVTRLVAAVLGLPVHPWGIIPRSDMDLVQRIVLAVPVVDTVGICCVLRGSVYYALPLLPHYEIDAAGRVHLCSLVKM